MDYKTSNKLIFTAYQDENNIRLAISPQFNAFTNNHEYYIDLGNTLMKMTIESIRKLDMLPSSEKQEEAKSDE